MSSQACHHIYGLMHCQLRSQTFYQKYGISARLMTKLHKTSLHLNQPFCCWWLRSLPRPVRTLTAPAQAHLQTKVSTIEMGTDSLWCVLCTAHSPSSTTRHVRSIMQRLAALGMRSSWRRKFWTPTPSMRQLASPPCPIASLGKAYHCLQQRPAVTELAPLGSEL